MSRISMLHCALRYCTTTQHILTHYYISKRDSGQINFWEKENYKVYTQDFGMSDKNVKDHTHETDDDPT